MASSTSGKQLLCEGWAEHEDGGEVFQPAFAYVTQRCDEGTRAWCAFGSMPLEESADLHIVERYEDLELEERQVNGSTVKLPKGGKWIVEGPGQRSGVKNANQRIYSRKIWERLIGDKNSYVQQMIAERRMIGHLEHPKDGKTDLKEAAILVVGAELKEDGTVWNRFELLETPNGQILQDLTRAGVRWGVSSRGTGTVKDDGSVNENDYYLKTWDAVAAPSTPGAYPGVAPKNSLREALDEESAPYVVHFSKLATPVIRYYPSDEAARRDADELSNQDSTYGTVAEVRRVRPEEMKALVREDRDQNTGGDAQGALSEDQSELLARLEVLSESGIDDLTIDERATLRADLFDVLTLDENILQDLLNQGQAWATIQRAVERVREADTSVASIDEAIEQILEGGEDGDESSGFVEVIESLQEQVSEASNEAAEARERREAVESEKAGLQIEIDALQERLSEVQGELARVRAERDLARELLSEAPSECSADVEAAVEEAIAVEPGLVPHRTLLMQAGDATRVQLLAEQLTETVVAKASAPKPASTPRRNSLPAGISSLDETYAPPSRPAYSPIEESSGARLVAAMPAFRKKS